MKLKNTGINQKQLNNTIEDGGLLKDFFGLIRNIKFIVPVMIAGIAAWGELLTTTTVSIDGLSADRYFNGMLIGQNRVTSTVVEKYLMAKATPFFDNLVGFGLFLCGIIIICVILQRIYKPSSVLPLTAFAGIYLTFPLLTEYFAFSTCIMSTGFCTFFIALALYFVSSQKSATKSLLLPAVLIMVALSWYEAFALTYVAIMALILILAIKYNNMSQKGAFAQIIKYIVPLGVGTFFKIIFGYLVMYALNIPENYYAEKGSSFGEASINDFIGTILMYWVSKIFCYLPFTLVFIAGIIAVILLIKDTVSLKKPVFILLYAILFFSIFAFTIYYSASVSYRTEQAMPVFVAAIVYLLLLELLKKKSRVRSNIAIILTIVILFSQCQSTSHWANLEHKRYLEEKQVTLNISQQLINSYTLEKPVIFIGSYELSDSINSQVYMDKNSVAGKIYKKGNNMSKYIPLREYKICDTLVRPYLKWGIIPFDEPSIEICKFFEYHSVNITPGTKKQYNEAIQKYKNIPSYPEKGYIADAGDYIVIKLGDVTENELK